MSKLEIKSKGYDLPKPKDYIPDLLESVEYKKPEINAGFNFGNWMRVIWDGSVQYLGKSLGYIKETSIWHKILSIITTLLKILGRK